MADEIEPFGEMLRWDKYRWVINDWDYMEDDSICSPKFSDPIYGNEFQLELNFTIDNCYRNHPRYNLSYYLKSEKLMKGTVELAFLSFIQFTGIQVFYFDQSTISSNSIDLVDIPHYILSCFHMDFVFLNIKFDPDSLWNCFPIQVMLQHKTKAINNYRNLLDDENFSDVTIITADKKKIHAHKCIMALTSTVFSSMFKIDMTEKKINTVNIEDIEYRVLRGMLQYMYCGEVNDINEIATGLLYAADKYQIQQLKNICVEKLIATMDTNNVIGYIQLAENFNCEILKDAAIHFIVNHSKDVVNKHEFQELSKNNPTFFKIFKAMAMKSS